MINIFFNLMTIGYTLCWQINKINIIHYTGLIFSKQKMSNKETKNETIVYIAKLNNANFMYEIE